MNKMQNRKRQRGHRENSTPTTLNAPKVPKLNVSICGPIPPHTPARAIAKGDYQTDGLESIFNTYLYVSAVEACPKIVNVYDSDIDSLKVNPLCLCIYLTWP